MSAIDKIPFENLTLGMDFNKNPDPQDNALRMQLGKAWMEDVDDFKKIRENYLKLCKEASETFHNFKHGTDETGDVRFNLLYSADTFLQSALIPNPPEFVLDGIPSGDDNVDRAIRDLTDLLKGVMRYETDNGKLMHAVQKIIKNMVISGLGVPYVGLGTKTWGTEALGNLQSVPKLWFESIPWDCFYYEPTALSFQDVGWITIKRRITRKSLEMKLGPEVVEQIPDSTFEDDAQNQESAAEESLISTDNADVKAQYMTVYETWCKHNRYKYLTRGSDRYCFHFEEDPLGLENFYPIGTPIVPIEMESEFKPGVPYSIVKHLQDDLNQLSQKKSKLRRMVHIKLGLPVADEKIKKLIESDDDIVVPMPELFSEALENPLGPKAIQQAIFEYPIEKVANSLNLLEQEKLALIEEYRHVLGLDDLMSHGKSSEQEGYHKSKLRAMFGNQRIAPIKWQVANAVRDMYDIANQIIFLHYPKDQIIKKSGNRNINSENPELDNLLSDKQSIPYTIDVEESTFKFKNIEENLALKTAMDTIVKDLETYLASADPDDYEMHLAYLEWRQAELDLLPLDRAIKLKANNAIDIMRERIEGNIQSEKEEVEAFVQQFLESNQGSTEKDAMKAYQEMKDQEKLESMAKFDKDYREQQSNETKEANQMALENKKLDQERDQKEKDREVQQEANNLKREEIRTNRQLGAQDIKVKKDANSITRKEVQIEEELGWKNVELKEKQINMGQSPSETPSPEVTGN